MTKAMLVIALALSLAACENLDRFKESLFGAAPPPAPPMQTTSAPAPALAPQKTGVKQGRHLQECVSPACRRECRLASAPKWCLYFKKPI